MEKETNILNLVGAARTYTNFIINLITRREDKTSTLLDKEYNSAAKVGFISNILLSIKEDLLEESPIARAKSKIALDSLEKVVETISIKKDSGYLIDNYYFSTREEVVLEVRNRLAHGNYKLDLLSNQVILEINNNNVRIDIDKLTNFVIKGLYHVIYSQKDIIYKKSFIKIDKLPKARTKPITTNSEMIGTIRKAKYCTIAIKRKDGKEVEEYAKRYLENIIKLYKKEEVSNISPFTKKQVEENYDIEITTNNKIFRTSDFTKIVDYLLSTTINNDYEKQIDIIGREIERKIDNNIDSYSNNIGSITNLLILDTISKYNIQDKDTLLNKMKEDYGGFLSDYNLLISSLIATFTAVFSYSIDDLYKDLDYSRLDLEMVKVNKLTIDRTLLDSQIQELSNKRKELRDKEKNIVKISENINKVLNKNNIAAYNKLNIVLNKLNNDKEIILNDINNICINLNNYSNNYKYLRNKSIIQGIRNSISHGSYRVILNGNISDTEIEFTSIYNNKLTFSSRIKLIDFINLLEDNLKPVEELIYNNAYIKSNIIISR